MKLIPSRYTSGVSWKLLPLLTMLSVFVACDKARNSARDRSYALESVISFGTGGGSEKFRGEGWGETERLFTWTVAPTAKLHLRIASVVGPLGLRMRLGGAAPAAGFSDQLVQLFVNGKRITEWHVGKVEDFVTPIEPKAVGKRGELEIELRIAHAASPSSLGISSDGRLLGVSCFEMDISRGVRMHRIWPKRVDSPPNLSAVCRSDGLSRALLGAISRAR